MGKFNIITRMSVNPNIVFKYNDSTENKKVTRTDFTLEVNGSSMSIANALRKWGNLVTLLETAINTQTGEIDFRKIKILTKTNFALTRYNQAIMDNSQSIGFLREIVPRKIKDIKDRIVTILEEKMGSYVALSGIKKDRAKLLDLFRHTDMLIINNREFDSLGM